MVQRRVTKVEKDPRTARRDDSCRQVVIRRTPQRRVIVQPAKLQVDLAQGPAQLLPRKIQLHCGSYWERGQELP